MMRKKDIVDNDFFVVTADSRNTRHHNGLIYEVNLLNFNKQEYVVYVDPTMRNWAHWSEIINKTKAGKGLLIENVALLRDKDTGKVIPGRGDADSKPVISYEGDCAIELWDELNDVLMIDPQRAIFRRLTL